MARRKIDVSRSEMLQMREQGLSNKDIADCLEISVQTVRRYIGSQGRHMDSLAAFAKPKVETDEPTTEEAPNPSPRAVDKLELVYEVVKSAEGNFTADLDLEGNSISLLNGTLTFAQLPELVTFVVGIAGRINNLQEASPKAFK